VISSIAEGKRDRSISKVSLSHKHASADPGENSVAQASKAMKAGNRIMSMGLSVIHFAFIGITAAAGVIEPREKPCSLASAPARIER